jgi:hypothetical protein
VNVDIPSQRLHSDGGDISSGRDLNQGTSVYEDVIISDTENIRGLDLAMVKLTTVQVTNLPL